MKKLETSRRIILLFLSLIGLAVQVTGFGLVWFKYYKPMMEMRQIIFWIKGDILLISVYAVILLLISRMYGGMKIGYLKAWEVFFSQVFSTIGTNVIAYSILSLMYTKLITLVGPILSLLGIQIVWIAAWTALSQLVYSMLFPPRDLLLVSGERPVEDILRKFESRPDKYRICKCMKISDGLTNITEEIEKRYDGMIIWDVEAKDRNFLLKYCYGRSIRVYVMPKIPDVLIKGTDEMHIFDAPMYLIREYALTVEQRAAKRLIDLICAFILLVVASPVMLITAVIIKCYDGGPVFYHQTRCTMGGKEFQILKFRSMRVDAEKDGVARLASKKDDRITPIGHVIRSTRIDELPQLLNILKGEMSFIGPRPERPEIIKQYTEIMPEFVFRMKVKAGLAGYAQVYGKYNTTPYDKLKLDLTYIENYSVWLDLKLMLLTIKVIFQPDSTEGVDSAQITALKTDDSKKRSGKK
ncbi:exopolysaccharide biosynthesis polyprenyl glycosylphosphotransferase [Lachnospiraceae bacterium XPB1003]|nr:exopolysaccharide biosynthesis polyprenyl glycosylphosphotransferase [Lachnospiraceae bacterium XPB1003]